MDDFEWRPDFQLYFSPSRNTWAMWDSEKDTWVPVNMSSADNQAYDGESEASDEEGRESGEVSEEEVDEVLGRGYKPEYEWPGDEFEQDDRFAQASSTPPVPLPVFSGPRSPPDLRLVVLSSEVLSSKRKFAAVHASEGTSIGRDSAPGRRLRLKEMAVSKFHANVFWDHERLDWAIADVGSMHGTYVRSAESSSPVRLSPARTASPPRGLKHLDVVTIGSTSLLVHIHQDGLPCQHCFFPESYEISLDNTKKKGKSVENNSPLPSSIQDKKAAARKDISNLRTTLLSRIPSTPIITPEASYIDRSARRRRLFPYSNPSTRTGSPKPTTPTPATLPTSSATPIPSSNIGHALLLKQGWSPGMTLGTPTSQALSEPLVAVGTTGRAGLGSKQTQGVGDPEQGVNWRDQGRQRRFTSLRDGGQ